MACFTDNQKYQNPFFIHQLATFKRTKIKDSYLARNMNGTLSWPGGRAVLVSLLGGQWEQSI